MAHPIRHHCGIVSQILAHIKRNGFASFSFGDLNEPARRKDKNENAIDLHLVTISWQFPLEFHWFRQTKLTISATMRRTSRKIQFSYMLLSWNRKIPWFFQKEYDAFIEANSNRNQTANERVFQCVLDTSQAINRLTEGRENKWMPLARPDTKQPHTKDKLFSVPW